MMRTFTMPHLQESPTSETRDVREAPAEQTKPIIARLVSLLAQNGNDDLDTGEMISPVRRSHPSPVTAAHREGAEGPSTDRPGSERKRAYPSLLEKCGIG